MSEVNFYLKKAEPATPENPNPKRLIYLQFKYGGRHKLVFTFKQKIHKKNWNEKKQRAKSVKQTTEDGKYLLNDLLNNLERECLRAYNTEIKNGVPRKETLRKYLIDFMNQNSDKPLQEEFYDLLNRFINGEVRRKGKIKVRGTLNNYNALKIHLQEFEMKRRYKITFDEITLDFFDKYVGFLEKKSLAANSIAKDIRLLKAVMNKAVSYGLTKNVDFRHEDFNMPEEETDAVYLTDSEIIKLYNHDFSDNKKLERERDRFIYGCFVGLRFSDHTNVTAENVISIDGDTFIKIITQKTGDLVVIPCNPIVTEIFDKYGGRPPKPISNQKFNSYVKELCKAAGLIEKGRLSTDPKKPLYECVSSHTCRRSFATNLYLDGFPTIDLMKVTAHKTEKAFLKYIRVSKLDTAKRLSQHMKRHWEDKLRKAESTDLPQELLELSNQN